MSFKKVRKKLKSLNIQAEKPETIKQAKNAETLKFLLED